LSYILIFILCSPVRSILDPDIKVVSGQTAKEHYPYQLSLQYYKPGSSRSHTHFCGASILSEYYLITAAHCITPMNISEGEVSALAGVSDLSQEAKGTRHQLISCIVHPNFIELISSDIALCKVQLPFVFGENVARIELEKEYLGSKCNCTLTGWGSIFAFRYLPIPFYSLVAYPDKLQEVNVPTLSNDECRDAVKIVVIDETQMCTFSRIGKGACAGDSGGPLVRDGKLVGIVSYGTIICTIGLPDVFTRVSYFYDWINSNVQLESAALTKESEIHSIMLNLPNILKEN